MEVKNDGLTLSLICTTAQVSEVEMKKENPQIIILKRESSPDNPESNCWTYRTALIPEPRRQQPHYTPLVK